MFAFGVMVTCCLLFSMAAIPLFHQTLFTGQPNPEPIGWLILASLSLVTLFTITALGWLLRSAKDRSRFTGRDVTGVIWGAFCLLFMIGEKVMIDEIAREWQMGWETTGEWVILYFFLTIQLGFTLYMLDMFRRKVEPARSDRVGRSDATPADRTH